MTEAWLRLAKPELRGLAELSTYSVYKFKKAFLTAEARISYHAFYLPAVSGAGTVRPSEPNSNVGANDYSSQDLAVRIETYIEFQAKIPIRKPDLYEISSSGALPVNGSYLVDMEMNSTNVNRGEVEVWTQKSVCKFVRERSHQKSIELNIPDFLSGLILPAPFATRALADCWNRSVRQYNSFLLAGKKLVAVRINPGLIGSDDGVSLEIEFLKFDLAELSGTLENFDHLRWNTAQKLRAVFSQSQKEITLVELELPIFGALALQKIES